MFRLLLVFGIGFLTWFLCLARTRAFIRQQVWKVSGLIFIEEFVLILLGMWMARIGSWVDAAACALGGATAAFVEMLGEKHGGNRRRKDTT